MFNKELLLSGGRVDAEPHVIMTIDYTSDNFFIYWGYNEGTYRPGAVNRKPYWTKGSGNKLTFNLLVDYKDDKPDFYGTGLNFKNGSSYFTSGDSFRLTRADTKEVIELFTGAYNLTTFHTSKSTAPFFHDLGQGDSVGIFFDPPPDGYL
jgi:hypothetical protein